MLKSGGGCGLRNRGEKERVSRATESNLGDSPRAIDIIAICNSHGRAAEGPLLGNWWRVVAATWRDNGELKSPSACSRSLPTCVFVA